MIDTLKKLMKSQEDTVIKRGIVKSILSDGAHIVVCSAYAFPCYKSTDEPIDEGNPVIIMQDQSTGRWMVLGVLK